MKHPIFSYFNLSLHLGIEYKDIKTTLVCMNTCIVTLKTEKKIKVLAQDLKELMENVRADRSKDITITPLHDGYKAFNKKKQTTNYLQGYDDRIECTCKDYHNQFNYFKQESLCKHGIALMDYFGCNTLKEYKEMVESNFAQYEAYCDRQEMMSYGWYDDSRHW